jgi:hypothetical protein
VAFHLPLLWTAPILAGQGSSRVMRLSSSKETRPSSPTTFGSFSWERALSLSVRWLARITLVVNSDSLHTWALPGLVEVAEHVQRTILREDQDHALDLVRRGAAQGAVTATAVPVPGCISRPLGVMRYRPVCTPAFAALWFADGVTSTILSTAPVVIYDGKDDLQDR